MIRLSWAATLGVLAAAAMLIAGATMSTSTFTTTKENSQTVTAASSWTIPLHMVSGSYVGDGTSSRSFKTPFKPDYVLVRGSNNVSAVVRTATMSGDQSKPLAGATALLPGAITSLNSDGFNVGSAAQVNATSYTYNWMAIQADPQIVKFGSYVGDGTASKAITGVGFSPEYVALLDSTNQPAIERFAGMSRAYVFDAGTGSTSRITSLDPDGFTVGSAPEANRSGDLYHYVAFNEDAGSVDVGSYTGNGADNRDIGGVGFKPGYLLVRADDSVTARSGVHRLTGMVGDVTYPFGAVAAPNLIQSFGSDGFQVGTDGMVNAASTPYFHLTLRNSADACRQAGTFVLTDPEDAWVDQLNALGNYGTDTTLKVRSLALNNRRALVRFVLPKLDVGCTITEAKLLLTTTSAKAGRTLKVYLNAGDWSASNVNWTNKPGTKGAPVTAPSSSAAGQVVTFDLTAQAAGIADGSISYYGWDIEDTNEGDVFSSEQQFSSTENASIVSPQLVLSAK